MHVRPRPQNANPFLDLAYDWLISYPVLDSRVTKYKLAFRVRTVGQISSFRQL